MFRDRVDAACRLAAELRKKYAVANPLVLAIPRGGLPLGRIIADKLNGDLDVVLVRKIGAPGNPEVAIGSIAESGEQYISDYAHSIASEHYIRDAALVQMEKIQQRRRMYTPVRPAPISRKDRTVIVVDDGLATGATMFAALRSVREEQPRELVCAVPVASTDGFALCSPLCDTLVCLRKETYFGAVGQYYRSFDQVEDEEAVNLLRNSSEKTS